jgi:hypothetical protein
MNKCRGGSILGHLSLRERSGSKARERVAAASPTAAIAHSEAATASELPRCAGEVTEPAARKSDRSFSNGARQTPGNGLPVGRPFRADRDGPEGPSYETNG